MENMDLHAKVLIIYSDKLIGAWLKLILEKQGYQVVLSGTLNDANVKLHTHTIHVVVLELPRHDSVMLTAIASIRRCSNAPIILFSTKRSKALVSMALQAGAAAYLLKPFRAQELLTEIARLTTNG